MKHPTSELAEYLDGTLSAETRAVVGAHVDACGVCADEVRAAAAARAILRAQPAVVAPPTVGMEAIAEARGASALHTRHEAARRAPTQLWARWAAVAGVAAGVLLLAAVVLPNVAGRDPGGTRSSSLEGDAAAVGPATAVEIVDGALDEPALQQLATSYRVEEGAAGAEGPMSEATSAVVVADTNDSPADVEQAIACLETAWGSLPAPPVRLLEARVQGVPAVIGVVLAGPGAGEPPDTAYVYVAAQGDCSIIPITAQAEL